MMADKWGTLKFLCQCISPAQNTEKIFSEINSTEFDWESMIYCSGQQLVTPALWFYLKKKEILPLLNQQHQDYLQLIYDLNLSRNNQIKEQLLTLLPAFNAAGIEPLLMKGIASLLGELYESSGIRVLGDIDFLVAEDKLHIAKKIMLQLGYTYTPFPFQEIVEEHKHLPGFVHNDQPVAIEIHRYPVALKFNGWVNIASAGDKSTQIFLKTGTVRLPSPEFRLLHNFCHCQVGDRGYFRGYISVRQMLEWVKLREMYEHEFNWGEIQERVEKNRSIAAWGGYILAAERYFSQPVVEDTELSFLANFFIYRLQWAEQYAWSWKINLIVDRIVYYAEKTLSTVVFNFKRGPKYFVKTILFLFKQLFSLQWIKAKYKIFKTFN